MATKKKTSVRRVPRSTTPRTFGDGAPVAPEATAEAPGVAPANSVASTRSSQQDFRRRVAARSGEARVELPLEQEYSYVPADLRRLGLIALAMVGVMVVLGLIIH